MTKQCRYWYFEKCPLIEECSTKWLKCGGKSPVLAKLSLSHHLVNSLHHDLSIEQSWIVACDTKMKCRMMDDDNIDETKVGEKKSKVEVDKNKGKIEENRNTVKVEENRRSVKVEENEKKVKAEEVDETEPRSVKPTPRKKRKFDDRDRPTFLGDATNKVEQGLHSLRIAKATMLESKLALKKAHLLTRFVARGRASRGSSD